MKKALVLLVLAWLTSASAAYACSCGRLSPAEAFEGYDVILVATADYVQSPLVPELLTLGRYAVAKAKSVVTQEDLDFEAYTFRKVGLRAQTLFKGHPSAELAVLTGLGHGDCGYPFEEGKDYLICATFDEHKNLRTGICSRTKPISAAAEDLRYLRARIAAQQKSSPNAGDQTPNPSLQRTTPGRSPGSGR